MRDALSQRYIDPEGLYEDDESEHERKMAEVKKAKGLKALEDTKWLPNLLNEVHNDHLGCDLYYRKQFAF